MQLLLEDLPNQVSKWIEQFDLKSTNGSRPILCLEGDLGAGKSTCIQEFLKQLGVKSYQGSPTYPVLLSYFSDFKIAHLDLYRVESETELEERGIIETLSDLDTLVFVEWGSKFQALIESIKRKKIYIYFKILNSEQTREVQYLETK